MENHNTSCEPMEIDLSSHSNHQMEISYIDDNDIVSPTVNNNITNNPTTEHTKIFSDNNNSKPSGTNIKKFHIQLQKDHKNNVFIVKLFVTLIILLLSIITYHIFNIHCCDDLDLHILESNLSIKLFGQQKAAHSLIETLGVQESSKIIFMYGGTGVGKTFTISVLLELTAYPSNVYHYMMPSFDVTFTADFMMGLTVCKQSFVIVDDLSLNDQNTATHISNIISKSKSLEKNITIFLIYNCKYLNDCDDSFQRSLLEQFKHIDAFKKFIKYEPLKIEHLRKCIETELEAAITETQLEKILKNFDVISDGCKGVHKKMKILDYS